MKLRGCLDSVTSSGFVEGWAFDELRPLNSLTVGIVNDGCCIAEALANRFRDDLADIGYGAGWCAFRARLSISPTVAYACPLVLVDQASGQVIHQPRNLTFHEDSDQPFKSVSELVASDPTLVRSLQGFRGCGQAFNAFIKHKGIEAFVRAAYVFILSRPGDAEGVLNYAKLIRQSRLDPMDLLLILADSEECRGHPRPLEAPNTAAFPFHLD